MIIRFCGLLLPLLAGCDGGYACLANVNPAIEVAVVDAATGLPLPDATGFMQMAQFNGDGSPVALYPGGVGLLIGFGGAGTYRVQVDHAGYATWVADEIAVGQLDGHCGGIATVRREAALAVAAPGAGADVPDEP